MSLSAPRSHDRWECRRRREAGHDWCILELGLPGVVSVIEVDTAFFTGNQSPQFSVQVCDADADGGAAAARLAALRALRVKTGDAAMGTKATAEAMAAAEACGSQGPSAG